MTTAIKTAKVKVSYTGWDWDDTYTMTSSTGRHLRVKPNGHWSHGGARADVRLTEAEEAVLEKIVQPYRGTELTGGAAPLAWGDSYDLEVTYDEMRLFASAAAKTK